MGRCDHAERRISRSRGAGDGNAQRASMRGLAGGLPAHRTAWPIQLLRGIHSHRRFDNDEFLAPAGRVMEMLSEHQCEGWLEGYLLTGRHGLFNCYEAFIHIVDS